MRKDRLYMLDIVEACEKVARYISGKSLQDLERDELLFDAVVRNLQLIGEAVRNLPIDARALRADIEWNRIVGLRHLLVHQYFGVDHEIVWDLASNRCPELKLAVEDMIRRID